MELKHELLIEYAGHFGSQAFIETCPDDSTTLKAMQKSRLFAQLHMISRTWDELCVARRRLSDKRHAHFWRGDLAQHLARLAPGIPKPVLFWLRSAADGLVAVNLRNSKDDVILIDGFRQMKRRDFQQFKNAIRFPDWVCEVKDNIIRCHRREEQDETPA